MQLVETKMSRIRRQIHLTSQCASVVQVENVKVESGPEGYAQFLQAVRELFGITADLEMELTFDCAEPATGGLS